MQRTKPQIEYAERRRIQRDALPKIPCECHCGTMIPPVTALGKPAHYALGHNPRPTFPKGQRPWNAGLKGVGGWPKGKPQPVDAIRKRSATVLAKKLAGYQAKRGWKHTPETIAKMTASVRQRDLSGHNNPFYGRTHGPEARARMSQPGDVHPHWHGGVGTLPYGPEFTRRYKRMIRERDGYSCRRCGVTQDAYGRTLQIHHLDHNKFNNDPTNLATACGRCNIWASYHRDEPFLP